jgi:site-specific DNA-methyltransferase (adenine-specific)
MEIINRRVDEIIPYENNPRNNEEAVKYVAESIKKFGFKVPIIIDKNNIIVTGHTRLKAAKELGMEEVPTIMADDLTEEQIKAFRLADNKVSEYATWDFEKLADELEGIIDLDMSELGFDFDIEEEPEVELIEDAVPEPPKEAKSKPGEIYQLGNHYLMCGDSTSEEDVEKLMHGAKADLVVTDPPYNVNISNSQGMTIENDNMGNEQFLDFLTKAFKCMNNSLKEGGAFYIWFASREHINFERALNNNDLIVRQELIWNKSSLVLSRQDYQWKHEPCLYGWKDGAGHYFIDDRKQTTVIEDKKPDIKKMKKEEMQALLEEIYSDKISTTIINEDRPSVNDLHPTMKPVKLMARLIKNSSKLGESVLDLFGGSGSTLMTCEQLGRKCYTMEYDPIYVDVIINRWETFTGEKAKKING